MFEGLKERIKEIRESWSKADDERDKGLKEPENIRVIKDLSYGPVKFYNLMDLYLPKNEADTESNSENETAKYPVVVSVHGGGYVYGDKERYRFYCMEFAKAGFAVVNFNYRLSPAAYFPAPLEDLSKVMKWLLENAEEYSLDLDRVCLIGDSAGAQIASQYAAIATNPEYAKLFDFEIPDVKIYRMSLACGLYDIERMAPMKEHKDTLMSYLGKKFDLNDPRIKVLKNITADYPTTYLFSAKDDFLREECEPMAKLLIDKGVVCEYKIYGIDENEKLAHVFHINLKNKTGKQANEDQFEFLSN